MATVSWCYQWHNRRGGGGKRGQSAPPETSDREMFADVSGKKRQGRKGKRGENLEEKFVCLFVFLIFTFENEGNLFWVYQTGNFLPGKDISRQEKNQEK